MARQLPRNPADIRTAAQVRRRFRQAQILMGRALGEVGLTGLQYHLLLEVGASGPPGLLQGELSERLTVPEAKVSMLLKLLLARDLVRSTRESPDRRLVRIRLSTQGRRLLVSALERQRCALAEMVAGIPPEEMTAIVEWGMKEYLQLPGAVEVSSG